MLKPKSQISPVITKEIPNLGMPERTHTNPGLLRWRDHWLMVSCAGLTYDGYLVVSRLNDDLEVTHAEVLATAGDRPPITAGAEDARLFMAGGKPYLTYNVTYGRNGDWRFRNGRIVLCEFDPDNLQILKETILEHPSLKGFEKNWIFYENRGFINFIYQIHRFTILGLVYHGNVRFSPTQYPFFDWHHGYPRGSTPAVLVGDEYYALMHSHVEETKMRHYVAGMFTFKTNPFRFCRKTGILMYPPKANEGKGPLPHRVVFPCGLALHDGLWYTSYGVNDYESRISAFSFDDVERELRPVC
jgi:hypothetical protein